MASSWSARFTTPDTTGSKLVRHHLVQRSPAGQAYDIDPQPLRDLIARIGDTAARGPARPIEIVEIYSAKRYCAAFEPGEFVFLDYGFIELLSDSIAMEYLHRATEAEHSARLAAVPEGRPFEGDGRNHFRLDQEQHFITGSMMMRDIACKCLDELVPEAAHRERLMKKLLWSAGHGARPNRLWHRFLTLRGSSVDVMPAFDAEPAASSGLADQTLRATAFVTCHEISHLVYSDDQRAAWRASQSAFEVLTGFGRLCALRVPGDEQHATLRQLVEPALLDAGMAERVHREWLVDVGALDLLLEHAGTRRPDPAQWTAELVNLFSLVAMTNSLGIFRAHLRRSILGRRMDWDGIRAARSEAVTRNLLVLAYLLHRHRALSGPDADDAMLTRIDREWLVLERRMIYFYLDLTAGVSEEDWAGFIDSALS